MLAQPRDSFRVLPQYQPLMRVLGIDAEAIFTHPQIVAWRKLDDRENCTLDGEVDGRAVRLHIKRYFPARGFTTPAEDEVKAFDAMRMEQIPTAPLVGWGKLIDHRSFIITEDLEGYRDAEKAVAHGLPFASILQSTADVAAKLHQSGLHHRDLYLCHFFVRSTEPNDVRLIDIARVRRLGGFLTRQRWIVKDLAQFWYSTLALPVTDEQRAQWLRRYAEQRGIGETSRLRSAIERKVKWIARHDAKLKQSQPTRNVSIPK
jgi:hypothetical protein